MVGAPGFEPGASRSRTVRATKLRYAPLTQIVYMKTGKKATPFFGGVGRIILQ